MSVQPFRGAPSGPGAKWQISTGGGADPHWRRDGKELYYLAGDGKLMAAAVRPGAQGTFEAGVPEALFEARLATNPFSTLYGASADGKRFLLRTPADEAGAPTVTVVVNWMAGLKR